MAGRDLNFVIVIGRLTNNVELKYTTSGLPVAKFSIANNTFFTQNKEKKNYVNYFDIVVWGNQAVNCQKYLKKGSQIAVEGHLRQNRWTDANTNKTISKIEIIATSIQFLTTLASSSTNIDNLQGQNNISSKQVQNGQQKANPFDDIGSNDDVINGDIYDSDFTDDNFGNGDDDIPF